MGLTAFARQRMTRKDSEKDSERPHYYSQFWLDIAAGRRTIGGPKPEEEGEFLEDVPEPIALRRPLLSEPEEDLESADGHMDDALIAYSVAEPITPLPDEVVEPAPDEVPAAVVNDLENPTQNDTVEDADIPDMDFTADEEEEDEDEEVFEDEDEEDEGWVPGRGRKKVSPKRPVKQPPPKRTKREPRRGF
ncbi:MAG: hypothetical protein NVS4B11_14580 [Ktedonobacteraceae bacterium]